MASLYDRTDIYDLLENEDRFQTTKTHWQTVFAGKEIRTLEGEAKGGKLSHVQLAYAKSGAVQCGFCTPGLIMATTAMLAKPREKPLTITEIRRGLAGNLCRCTGYQMIVNTVLDCEKTK